MSTISIVSPCFPPPEEKGLPPSRLMLEQAAQKQLSSTSKESQKPEVLRHSELNRSLNTSSAYMRKGKRHPLHPLSMERIRSILEETNKCYFCEYKAPVPWVHPRNDINLSGMDIWDRVWSDHPNESEWFAWLVSFSPNIEANHLGNIRSVCVDWLALLGCNAPNGSGFNQKNCSLYHYQIKIWLSHWGGSKVEIESLYFDIT